MLRVRNRGEQVAFLSLHNVAYRVRLYHMQPAKSFHANIWTFIDEHLGLSSCSLFPVREHTLTPYVFNTCQGEHSYV